MIIKPKIVSDSGTGSIEVRFLYLDIVDGKLVNKIVKKYCDIGGNVTPPNIPTSLNAVTKQSCDLNFYNWNITNLTNIQHDLDVGALYNTADGKTHAFILLNNNTGLSPAVYFNKSDTSELTISWGDGSANYTTSSSGNLDTSHTYSANGIYEITMWISSGSGTYTIGQVASSNPFISYYNSLKYLYIGENVTSLPSYCLSSNASLSILSLSHNITSMAYPCLNNCTSLKHIITSYLNTCGDSYSGCNFLNYVSLVGNFTVINDICSNCYSLKNFVMPDSVSSINVSSPFRYCTNLESIHLSNSITSVTTSGFEYCYALKKINFENIILASDSALRWCSSLEKIILNSSVTTINSGFLAYCTSLKSLTLTRYTAPSTITSLASGGITGLNTSMRIYVPVGSLSVYQNATNWSTYANRMYEDTPENRALFGD